MAFTVTVTDSGVVQHSVPEGETLSQAPPLLVVAVALKEVFVFGSALAIDKICGKGFAPPTGIVKLMGFTCQKTASPTYTATGTVTVPLAAANETCPTNVPASAPPPGSAEGVTEIVTVVGAVPFRGEALSQFPPSDVLVLAVQVSVPLPALRICRVCAGTLVC